MLLWLAMAILAVAEIAYVLQSILGSIAAIAVTLAVFMLHWGISHYFRKNRWAEIVSVGMRLLVILAPLIYLLVQIFVLDSPVLWLQLLLLASFIVPLLLMFYASRLVQQLLDETVAVS